MTLSLSSGTNPSINFHLLPRTASSRKLLCAFTTKSCFNTALNPFPRLISFPKGRGVASMTRNASTVSIQPTQYEFSDNVSEVELRIPLSEETAKHPEGIIVDTDEDSLMIKVLSPGSIATLMEINHLYEKIKSGETIWYIDEDQLVVNLKKHDTDLKWPDVTETWESLSTGVMQLLKGASIYTVGSSTEMNWEVAQKLASGLGYTPLKTSELLEAIAKQSINSWITTEGADSVAEAEGAILESLSSHVRAVVATLGEKHGAAGKDDKWRHLYAGFTVWLDHPAGSEDSAVVGQKYVTSTEKQAYANAEVIVKLDQWNSSLSQIAAQACLSALKRLILSDKQLPGKKSLYIRLGCRGDWPNIEPPGYDPSKATKSS